MIREFQIDEGGFPPLKIGMSRHDIDKLLGEHPKSESASLSGEEAFRYDGAHARVAFRQDKAVEIALAPPAKVSFQGMLLFEERNLWRTLVTSDGDAQEVFGFIVLRAMGLTLTGFHDEDRGQLAITAFEPGRWDELQREMRPLRL